MSDKESEMLAREISKFGSVSGIGGMLGANLVAKHLPNNSYELAIKIKASPLDVIKMAFTILRQNGQLVETAPIQGSNYDYFNPTQGLAPAGKGSFANTEAWRYALVAGSPENSYLGQGSAGSPEVIANAGQPIKSGFDITPGQASPEQIAAYNAKTGDYAVEPTFNIASTGSVAGANLVFENGITVDKSTGQIIGVGDLTKGTPTPVTGTGWYDEVTGKDTPVGVGTPRPVAPTGVKILNEADLQAKRKELAKAGVPQSEWNKYISSPDAQGNLYWTQPATLTSPTGEKKVVAVGSAEANQLLNQGYTLGDKVGGGTITSDALANVKPIDVGTGTGAGAGAGNTNLADQTIASIETDLKTTQEQIKANQELLKAPESDLSKMVKDLTGEAITAAGELTGRGAMQATEEQKRQIEQKQQAVDDKTTEINKKLAEVKALDAAYNLANQQVEGKAITMFSIQGQQAQNYKMYLAQKNSLTSEASYLQAELLGLQGKLDSAQKAADRAVDLEYQDREAEYTAKINQLNILIPQLDKEEKAYADAVLLTLNQQADALAEQKAAKKEAESAKLDKINTINQMTLNGYTYLDSPAKLAGLNESQITRIKGADGVDMIFKNPVEAVNGGEQKVEQTDAGGYPKGYWAAIKTGVAFLQKGEKWGTVYERLKQQFPTVSNEDLDKSLGTEWRLPGAFEEFKQKQYKETDPAKYQQQAGVWAWLATEEAMNMSNEQKKQEIMGAGFNPDDFGIY